MSNGIIMAEVSWADIEKAFIKKLPMIIPLGAGCKEHGLHLPMNTDFIIAEYLANWVIKNYQVLLTPTLQDSFFPAFVDYPGSTTLSRATSCSYLVEKCLVWAAQGAKQFYVLNTGISTNLPLADARKILEDKNIRFNYFNISSLYEHPEIKKIMTQKIGTHADEIETSMMLYIKPDVVDMTKAKLEEGLRKPGPLTRDISSTDRTVSVTGAWGNPTLATREKGEIAMRVLLTMLKEDLDKLIEDAGL